MTVYSYSFSAKEGEVASGFFKQGSEKLSILKKPTRCVKHGGWLYPSDEAVDAPGGSMCKPCYDALPTVDPIIRTIKNNFGPISGSDSGL